MSLIEQAAKRLEQLRRAGVDATDETPPPAEAVRPREHVPIPEAAAREAANRGALATQRPPGPALASPAPVTEEPPRAPAERKESTARLELDLAGMRARGIVTPDSQRSQIDDEFRVIKRPILQNASPNVGVRNGNLVMVTSALPGEGKTFTAINLAMSIGMELGTTVLLVDGDVAHPDLPNVLGVRGSPGLLELLTRDDVDISDALVRTNIPNLSILPAGSYHRHATELLASEQMATLVRELGNRYKDRIIVFDSPPLLATTEARVLAEHMGQVVMVVAADSTRQHDVSLALETLDRCDVVLMMLNKADKTDVGAYYGYYAYDRPG